MAQTLIDHDSIRRWADQHGARPARVRGTGSGSDPGILRLDFAGYSGEDSLDEIDWDEWFDKFDESRLALLVDESGRTPNFNKLRSPRRDGIWILVRPQTGLPGPRPVVRRPGLERRSGRGRGRHSPRASVRRRR
jgi:hypothetical protein